MSELSQDAWVIEPRSSGVAARAQEIWRYRRMFRFFGEKALRKLYQRTILGKAWIVLRPLVPLLVRVFVFGALLEVGSTTGAPYFLFLAVGGAAWDLFASCVMWATRSLQLNTGMLTRMYVPRLILPVATMAPGFANWSSSQSRLGVASCSSVRPGRWCHQFTSTTACARSCISRSTEKLAAGISSRIAPPSG